MAFELLVVLAGIVVGWARRGSLLFITNIRVRWLWLLPIAYLLQHFSISQFHGSLYEMTIVISYIGLILFCVINIKIAGVVWALVGTTANFLVMLANNLRMPAYLPYIYKIAPQIIPRLKAGTYGKSIAMGPHTHLNFLGDIFPFRVWPQSMISVGDVLFGVGFVIIIQHAMTIQRRNAEHDKNPDRQEAASIR